MKEERRTKEMRTIEFSQLKREEKERFYEFLVENDVAFELKDESYLATIKIVNQKANSLDKHKSVGINQNSHFLKSTIGSTYKSAKFSPLRNLKSPHAKSKSPAPKKRTLTPSKIYSKKKEKTGYEEKIRELVTFQREMRETEASSQRTREIKQKREAQKAFQKANGKRKALYSAKSARNNEEEMKNYTEYDKINKPFLPQTKRITENIGEYDAFLKHVTLNIQIRPKRLNLNTMIKMIEDIYTARFTEDTAYFKSSISMEMDEEHNIDFPGSSFPLFVYSYINTKFRHKKLIDQNCADLIKSVEYHRPDNMELELFAKFLCQEYDSRDLIFFLYVRSLIEREMDIKFNNLIGHKKKLVYFSGGQYLASGNKSVSPNIDVDTRNVFLNYRIANKIAKIFFEENEGIFKNFLSKVENSLMDIPNSKERQMSATHFMSIILKEFNQNRQRETEVKSGDASDEEHYDWENDGHHEGLSSTPSHNVQELDIDRIKTDLADHIINRRVDQIIDFMLGDYTQLDREICGLIKLEVKNMLSNKIRLLLEALFNYDKRRWLELLMIEDPDEQQLNYIESIHLSLRTILQTNSLNLPEMDQISRLILQVIYVFMLSLYIYIDSRIKT